MIKMKIDEIKNEPYFKIEKFIKSRGYNLTIKGVLKGYNRNKEGYRINFDEGQCIINLEDEIKQLLEDINNE